MIKKHQFLVLCVLLLTTIFIPRLCYAQWGGGIHFGLAKILNSPNPVVRDAVYWGITYDWRTEYKPFMFSLKIAGYENGNEIRFSRPLLAAQVNDIELRSNYEASNVMLGLTYYPIQKPAVFNPFVRVWSGMGFSNYSIYHTSMIFRDNHDGVALGYLGVLPPRTKTAFSAQVGAGFEISLSQIFSKEPDTDFSIRFSANYSYFSRMYFIDPNNLHGSNPVIGHLYDVENKTTHIVDIGNLEWFAPRYIIFELGLFIRFFDFLDALEP